MNGDFLRTILVAVLLGTAGPASATLLTGAGLAGATPGQDTAQMLDAGMTDDLVAINFQPAFGAPGPWGNTLYVRGGWNGWGTTNPMTWNDASEEFTAVISIDAGSYEFKIADDGWSSPDFGPTGDPNVLLGTATDIGTAIGANFVLSLLEDGDYMFRLFDIAGDLQSGRLMVSRVVSAGEPMTLALLGMPLIGLAIAIRRRRR